MTNEPDDYVKCPHCGEVSHIGGLIGEHTNDCPRCGKQILGASMIKVIPKVEAPNEVVLFLPEMPATRGNICFWSPAEGHGEASMDYYQKNTRRPSIEHETTIENLMERYARIGDYQTVVRVARDTRIMRLKREGDRYATAF
jgi:DNA-directed RNA polymerase subunit RPC12/RpoP